MVGYRSTFGTRAKFAPLVQHGSHTLQVSNNLMHLKTEVKKAATSAAAVTQMIKPYYKNTREITPDELLALTDFIAEEAFGDYDVMGFGEASDVVNQATVAVFPNFYTDGSHLVWVAWPDTYMGLPNHFEHFKISQNGKTISYVLTQTRRKYHRVG